MKKPQSIIQLLLFVFTIFSYSQETDEIVIKANNAFNNYAFINAQERYLEGIEASEKNEMLYKRLADAYYQTADYKNAAKWFEKWYAVSKAKEKKYILKYSQALKSIENYDLADTIIKPHIKKDTVNYLNEIENNSGRFTIKKTQFNSDLSDFAPTFYENGIVFASNRYNRSFSKNLHKWNNQPFLDLYFTISNDKNQDLNVKKISSSLNTKYHESTAIYTKDGQTVYFTRNNFTKGNYKSDRDGINRLKLYKGTKKENNNWEVEELPFNNDAYSVAHPALSVDEKTLYFSSDMPGGKGLSDLYKITISEPGYSQPVNLGDTINTEGRDTFPFISQENELYFASDGHLGLGGLDVFVAKIRSDNSYEKVFNVGRPINSPQDDFTFIINSKTQKGFFASNRSHKDKTDDNIYAFKRIKLIETKCNQTITGTILDKKTDESIANVALTMEFNQTLKLETKSNSDGCFIFNNINCSTLYKIKVNKEGYLEALHNINPNKKQSIIDATIKLQKKEQIKMGKPKEKEKKGSEIKDMVTRGQNLKALLNINPISFDSGKSDIRPDTAKELQKVIKFMITYSDIKLQVRSHTDSRGNDASNLRLSENRAKSTINYIIKMGGISSFRISGVGFGEEQLKNKCSNGVKCTSKQHTENRRSEFIVVD